MLKVDKKSFIFMIFGILLMTLLAGCEEIQNVESSTFKPMEIEETKEVNSPEEAPTKEESIQNDENIKFWIDPNLENHPSIQGQTWPEVEKTSKKNNANYWIIDSSENGFKQVLFEQYFVLSVPFINLNKNLDFDMIRSIWLGEKDEGSNIQIWIQPKDLEVLTKVMKGNAGLNVLVSESPPSECIPENCIRISDFEDIVPAWKVIKINQQSPLILEFDESSYPLIYRIGIEENTALSMNEELTFEVSKTSNFDPEKLSSILMTGTTALVRNTAFQIEENGFSFPYENIDEILRSVDLIHISNEVPFYSQCPPAIPVRPEMRFCSDPTYINTFLEMEVDIIELTGNHLLDWGPDAFLETLMVYDSNDIDYYGGGIDQNQASQPLLVEHHGNKFAFIGCNVTGPENNWADNDRPGALKCDLDEMETIVRELKEQDYIPIFTFQHFEFNTFRAVNQMQEDFWRIAKAGASIVSGSQAHYPHGFDFVDSSYIHYGLGNFFFDQMYTYWGMATMDIHYFYDNTYINTTPLAIINENFGQPRLMTVEEETRLMEKLFPNSFYYEKSEQ